MRAADYAMLIVRRGWLVLLVMALAAGGAYLLSSRQPAVYRATQLVLMQPSRSDFGLTQASSQLLQPAVVWLDSSLRAQQIIDELALDMLAQDLLSNVYINSDSLRLTVQIDVDSTDAELASRIAAAWGQQALRYREEQNQRARREDRTLAVLPDMPVVRQIAPATLINTGAGALLGLLLGVLLVAAVEFLERGVVRRRDDLERGLRVPVLANIPRE